jgi:hypothetical protein
MGRGTVHKGKGSRCGQGSWHVKGGNGGKGGKGGKDGQRRQGQRASPDGGVSPPEQRASPDGGVPPPEQAQRRFGGRSLLEGGWRMVPLPDDQVLKVLVPFLGTAL